MSTRRISLDLTRSLASLVMLANLFFFCSSYAQAGQIKLAWDASSSPGVAGYQINYGQTSGSYATQVDVGNQTSYTVTGLNDGATYYFAAKAHNNGKTTWSTFSNEASATIASTPTAPTANFNANPTIGPAPLMVTFTDASTGNITSRSWDFGDCSTNPSNCTSTATSGTKTYSTPGTYTMRLTVTGSGVSNTATKIISATDAPVANFSATPTIGMAPLPVNFTNSSTGSVTSYSWDFGDCSTNPNNCTSTSTNPAHTYSTAGTYTVSLTATGSGSTNAKTKNGYITVSSSSGGGGGSNAGLVGAYNFEEASGTTVVDASGKGNTGTISGATRITQGRFGKALSFDGVNDWVTVNDAASLDLTTGMTLEAWVYPTVDMTDWSTALLKENPSHGLAYGLYANTDTSQPAGTAYVGGDKNLHGGPWLFATTWTHLATTYNGSIQRLYVNGTEVANRAQSGSIEVSNGALRIGGNSFWGEFFKGQIDEIRIYNRALTAAEIVSDMNRPVGTSSPPDNTLIGTKTIGTANSNPRGKAEAFLTTAAVTGSVTSLSVYVDSGSAATKLVCGLYGDQNGHPGALLGQGTLSSPQSGSWNAVSVPTVSITAGSRYWIAVLGPSGVLQFRSYVGSGGQPSETSAQSTLTTLPSTWSTGGTYFSGPVSTYGTGYK